MFYVYVIYNNCSRKLYIGQTADIDARIKCHNNKHRTNSYTARFEGEWKMIHQESFTTRSEAIKREKQLKSSRGRSNIKSQYIDGYNLSG